MPLKDPALGLPAEALRLSDRFSGVHPDLPDKLAQQLPQTFEGWLGNLPD